MSEVEVWADKDGVVRRRELMLLWGGGNRRVVMAETGVFKQSCKSTCS